MSPTPAQNPRIPEGINASEEHPLKEFFALLIGISISLVIAVVMLGVMVKLTTSYIPFKWELELAPSINDFIEGEAGNALNQNTQAALVELGQKLLKAAQEKEIPANRFTFHWVDADISNAYATLGGHIVITDDLIRDVSSENGLAMVMAHEIAHIQLRHPIESASRGVLIQLLLAVVTGSTGNQLPGGILSSTSALTLLGFSREMESAADQRALNILREHYGHVGGADEFFRAMEAGQASARWLEFTQTHPNAGRRLEAIQQSIKADSGKTQLTPMHPHLRDTQQGVDSSVQDISES
jgi:predicted Zn-dependent protease